MKLTLVALILAATFSDAHAATVVFDDLSGAVAGATTLPVTFSDSLAESFSTGVSIPVGGYYSLTVFTPIALPSAAGLALAIDDPSKNAPGNVIGGICQELLGAGTLNCKDGKIFLFPNTRYWILAADFSTLPHSSWAYTLDLGGTGVAGQLALAESDSTSPSCASWSSAAAGGAFLMQVSIGPPIPEPSTWLLTGVGLALAWHRKHRPLKFF